MADTANLDNWQAALADQVADHEAALAEAGEAKSQKDFYATRERQARDKAASIKAAILEQMQSAGVLSERVNGWMLSVKAGRVALVEDANANPDTLPIDMVRITKVADKAAISAALTRGETVSGYSLTQSEPSLAITPPKGA